MKYVRFFAYVLLILSLFMNFVLYYRSENRRMQMVVNGHMITKKDYHNWLEGHYGLQTLVTMAKYYLVMDAAKKDGVPPDEKQVSDILTTSAEVNPTLAREFYLDPWVKTDDKQALEYNMAMDNLATKDISVTEDEVQSYFNANPGKWDKPDKIFIKAIQCANMNVANQAKAMMQTAQGDALTDIQRQLAPNAVVVGVDGTMAFLKPVGAPSPVKIVNQIAAMKPNQISIIPYGQTYLVVKFDHIEPGKKVTLADVQDLVALAVKKQRAVPAQEVLQKLWDSSNIITDPPSIKKQIENILFPDRALQNASNQ